jgi:5-methylthioadenosine/S-adenosylhomocysteine deaminase
MDPWFDLKFAALFHKTAAADPTALPARVALSWVTRAAAACVSMGDQIGSLRPGARADIITLRGDVPNAVPAPDPYSHLVYSVSGGDVETVVVDGRWLVRHGEFVNLDADRIRHELGRIRAKLVA